MSDEPKRFQFSLRTALIGMVVSGALLAIPIYLFMTIRTAGQAEFTLHATICAIETVEQFIKDHPGAWPKSWQDLQKTSVARRGMYTWPKDSEEIQKRVQIDFNVRLEDLAQQDLSSFKAIRSIGPYYDAYSSEVQSLLNTIRADVDLHGKKQGVVAP